MSVVEKCLLVILYIIFIRVFQNHNSELGQWTVTIYVYSLLLNIVRKGGGNPLPSFLDQ